MTPEQFRSQLSKQKIAPAYLFLGPEAYERRRCKEELVQKLLPGDLREGGFTQVSLEDLTLPEVLDDARSLSLFATDRVLWILNAEAALPRRLSSSASDDEDGGKGGAEQSLQSYVKAPTPGTTIVFECSRFDFSGDDKPRLDRVAKFYSAIPNVVECRPFSTESIRGLAQELVAKEGLKLSGTELAFLLEAVGGDALRLASEIDKLVLFAGKERRITLDDIRALTPNASQSNIFSLVNALGRRDRVGALRALDLLVRDGEYLPLALSFLGTQFRLALVAQEVGLQSSQQAVSYFSKQGVRMWRDRAEQLINTASVFGTEQLKRGLKLIYETDKGLRDTRPDDRTVLETLVMSLTR